MSERRCPKCGSVYTDTGARFCPKDGSMLVEIQARKPVAPPASGSGGTGVRTPLPPGKASGLDAPPASPIRSSMAATRSSKSWARRDVLRLPRQEISSNATVAIKVLSPRLASDKSSVERLRREADSRCASIIRTCAASCGSANRRRADLSGDAFSRASCFPIGKCAAGRWT